jgi:hypothetical protein
MSDNTLGDLTNTADVHNQHNKKEKSSGAKNDNAREALKAKLDFKNNSTASLSKHSSSSSSSSEKENDQSLNEKDLKRNNSTEDDMQKQSLNGNSDTSGVLTERRSQIKYSFDEEEEDSPEENEDEDEKENAMNKLKALLGPTKSSKKKPQQSSHHANALRKSSSYNEKENVNFMHIIENMRRDLYNELDIPDPEEEDDDDSISKIFYEGRNGQEYTISVLQNFFESLKDKIYQFTKHQQQPEKPKPSPKIEDDEYSEERESDKDRIKRKLNENNKKSNSKKLQNSNKESLKNLLKAGRETKKTPVNDIKEAIRVDSQVLNYGNVNPGKLLGSIINISNVSNDEQTIELSLDTKTETYDRNEIMKNKEFGYIEEVTNEEIELTEKEYREIPTEEGRNEELENRRRFIPNSEKKLD